jgi:16S rRNA (cytosine967-C5)-methyltransferase
VKLPRIVIAEVVTALREVFVHAQHADKVIERTFKAHRKWGARDRRLFAESVYDIVRWWRWDWHLAGLPDGDCLSKEAITEARLWQVWGAYWTSREGEWPPFAECRAVSTASVRAQAETAVPPAVRAAFPDWLYQLGELEIGPEWPRLAEALNQAAPVDIRVNTLKVSLRDLQEILHREDIEAGPVRGVPDALRLRERKSLFTTAAFKSGLFELQDAASQRIAPFVEVEPGMRVIDACAGAGGKTLHLAALMRNKGRIIALDIHRWKLEELRRRARRNGAGIVEAREVEDAKSIKRLSLSADRVLLDVPCSGLGVLRRNPDTKWKISAEELQRLRLVQRDILQSHSRMVKPGGKLVYATCSILPDENERQVRAFLADRGDEWKLEEELHLRPGENGGDGFYAARLIRSVKTPATAGPDATLEDGAGGGEF